MEYFTLLLSPIAVLFLIVIYNLAKNLYKRNSYWSSRGVKSPKGLPLIGHMIQVLRKGMFQLEKDWFAQCGKLYGLCLGGMPLLTIVDVELIKQVLIKDFHVFTNRDKKYVDHEIWGSNLFMSQGEQWKRIRAITSPAFTSGKLKAMHSMMNRCVDKLTDYFDKTIAANDGQINMKQVILGFTIDVIASTSFATETNANDDRSKQNLFVKNGERLFDFEFWRVLLLIIFPIKFNRWIGNSVGLDDTKFNFFVNLSREVVRQRKNGLKRNDIVQLMIDSRVDESEIKQNNGANGISDLNNTQQNESSNANSTKKSLTENEIIAQCIIFFGAGFETTATSIANCLYNLAIHPDIQNRLVEELSQELDDLEYNSDAYYETVMNRIPYLEAVIKETLRMAPPVVRLERLVGIDDYKLAGVPLDKGQQVNVSVIAVHYHAEYYPEPERFNPDRFMPENKHLLVPYTYLPFGAGPRNCIGMRFAYQEMKLCLAKIIRHYQFEPTRDTQIPLVFAKVGILTCKNIPLKVSKR